MYDFAKPARGQLAIGRRFVNGYDPTNFQGFNLARIFGASVAAVGVGVIQYLELRLVDLQAAPSPAFFDFSVERYHLTGLGAVAQIGAVEPNALESCPALSRNQFKDRETFGLEHARVAYFRDDSSHLTRLQLADPTGIHAIFVAKGQIVKQVLDSREILLRQP